MSWDGKMYDKYRIAHTDGTPLKGKKYFVLRLDSEDPVEAARVAAAMRAYKSEPRNCDVGTVVGQTERFDAFCQSNMKFYKDMFGHDDEGRLDGWDCREDCPVGRMIDSGTAVSDRCQLAWAQLPYRESKAKGD